MENRSVDRAIEIRLYRQRHDPEAGFFGVFEAIGDPAVVKALFVAAEGWLRQQSMKGVVGPFNPGINQETGLLADGSDSPPFVMMGHGRSYYTNAH